MPEKRSLFILPLLMLISTAIVIFSCGKPSPPPEKKFELLGNLKKGRSFIFCVDGTEGMGQKTYRLRVEFGNYVESVDKNGYALVRVWYKSIFVKKGRGGKECKSFKIDSSFYPPPVSALEGESFLVKINTNGLLLNDIYGSDGIVEHVMDKAGMWEPVKDGVKTHDASMENSVGASRGDNRKKPVGGRKKAQSAGKEKDEKLLKEEFGDGAVRSIVFDQGYLQSGEERSFDILRDTYSDLIFGFDYSNNRYDPFNFGDSSSSEGNGSKLIVGDGVTGKGSSIIPFFFVEEAPSPDSRNESIMRILSFNRVMEVLYIMTVVGNEEMSELNFGPVWFDSGNKYSKHVVLKPDGFKATIALVRDALARGDTSKMEGDDGYMAKLDQYCGTTTLPDGRTVSRITSFKQNGDPIARSMKQLWQLNKNKLNWYDSSKPTEGYFYRIFSEISGIPAGLDSYIVDLSLNKYLSNVTPSRIIYERNWHSE